MSDGGGIGGGAPLGGGGGGGTDVALPDRGGTMRGYEPPSHLDRSSDPANRRKTSRGFPGEGHDEDRPRDEADRKGKAKRDIARSVDKGTEAAKRDSATKAARRAASDPSDTSVAPQRLNNAAAKEAWSKVPAEVRGAVHQTLRELEHGLSVYRARAQRDAGLDGWHQLAAQSRTTVPRYLQLALSVEMGLTSTNPAQKVAAIEHCLRLAGVSPQQYSQFVRTDTPQARQGRQTNLAINQVAQRTEQLGKVTAQVQYDAMINANNTAVHQAVGSVVHGFASAVGTEHFEELSWDVAKAIREDPDQSGSTGERLQRAYDKVKSRRRSGRSSISGSPANGTNPSLPARRRGERPTIAESVDRARARLGG